MAGGTLGHIGIKQGRAKGGVVDTSLGRGLGVHIQDREEVSY
jgi:hypothetical protein